MIGIIIYLFVASQFMIGYGLPPTLTTKSDKIFGWILIIFLSPIAFPIILGASLRKIQDKSECIKEN